MKKKLIEGPLGFPMPEDLARNLETLLKSLPKDSAYAYRKSQAVPTAVELVSGERADISTISSDSLDREAEVVIAKGVNLTLFTKNPVVTWAHQYLEMPVGRAAWVKVVDNSLKAKTIYASRPPDWQGPWLPDAVFSMTQEGILRGKSIGFLPTKVRSPTKEELSLRPTWKNARAVIEESMMLEYAVAPVPVNQDCLVEFVSKGFADAATLKRLGIDLPDKPKTVKRKAIDPTAFLAALEGLTFDPNRIAEMIFANMKNKGRV